MLPHTLTIQICSIEDRAAISSIEQFWIVGVHGSVEVPSLPKQLKVTPFAHINK